MDAVNFKRQALLATAVVLIASCLSPSASLSAPGQAAATPVVQSPTASVTSYRTAKVNGLDIFYREAGPIDAPVIVLLHGFPASSHMFRNLIPQLSGHYRVIAPDYPGFGHSGMPDRKDFNYSFSAFTDVIDGLLTQLGARHYALYVMDYGAPVGFRLALKHPERVSAIIVQNGNAYEEGLKEFWDPIKAYWREDTSVRRDALRPGTEFAATRSQYLGGVRDVSRVSPDTWVLDQALLDRPGNAEIQLDLFKDYRTNVVLYPQFQAFFRDYRPPALIVWGSNDEIFPAEGARPYLRDLPDAELHMFDTGHFALEDKGNEIGALMRDFLSRKVKSK